MKSKSLLVHFPFKRFSMQWAGYAMLLCIAFCILSGCGRQESTSENETNRSVFSINASKSQVNEEGRSKIQQHDTQATKRRQHLFDVGHIPEDMIPRGGSKTQAELNPIDMEVIPSLRPGEPGITQAEIKALIKSSPSAEIDQGSFEVIPPPGPGEPGITQAKVEAQKRRLATLGEVEPDIDEVLPPPGQGESGITQAEVTARKELDDKYHPDFIEVIPPNRSGEPGITEAEINALRSLQAPADQQDLQTIFDGPVAK